jgi:hypothetical protein
MREALTIAVAQPRLPPSVVSLTGRSGPKYTVKA